jgi:hypothetical protein
VFVIEVPNAARLADVMNALRKLAGVSRVERRLRLLKPRSRKSEEKE